jgi:hypothetical protein
MVYIMIMKILTLIVFLLPIFSVTAADSKAIMAGLASEFSECSAYYGVLSQGVKNNPEAKKRMQDMSVYAMEFSVNFSNMKVALARAELDAKQMMKEMNDDYSNGAIIINKYGEKCKSLLEAPEKRAQEMMQK